jgi:hypothetical protein
MKSNRGAIGARVLAHYGQKQQVQEGAHQSSVYSSNDPRFHVGLGAEKSVDLEVHWLNGPQEKFKGIAADQIVVIKDELGILPDK